MNKSKTSVNGFIYTLGLWFAKFPPLPKNIRLFIVKIIPVLALAFGIIGILSSIDDFGGTRLLGYGSDFLITLLSLATSVLVLSAFPGLKARKIHGWNLLFWSEVVNLVLQVVAIYQSSILLALMGAIICFYLLFQIKPFYK
jgi:hypothetical protein